MKLREIERLRAVAALLVVCVHWWPLNGLLPHILQETWSGVDLFFVISGYVVSLSLARLLRSTDEQPAFLEAFDAARPSIKAFYVRRFFRIMPAAVAVALAIRVLAGVFPSEFGTTGDWLKEFSAVFASVYNYAFSGQHVHITVYWSLCVEEHFYLLLPILFLVFRTTQRRLAACVVVACFSIFCRTVLHSDAKPDDLVLGALHYSHNRFDSLMGGVALALVSANARSNLAPVMPRWVLRWAILPAAIGLVACLPATAPKAAMTGAGVVALWMLACVLVGYASLDRGYVLDVPVLRRVLEYVGARSYALYLVHQVVFRLERGVRSAWARYETLVPDSGRPWTQILVLTVATWLVVEALYHGVEKPMIRIGRRLLEASAPPRPPRLPLRWKAALATGAALFATFYFRHALLLTLGQHDLARGMAVYQSSHQDGSASPDVLANSRLEWDGAAQTRREKEPWEMIDLGEHTSIGAVRVYNRDDESPEDSYPIELEISDDHEHWELVARRDVVFTQEWPWRVRCYATAGRYLRLKAPRETSLGLSEVEVFGSTAMATIP